MIEKPSKLMPALYGGIIMGVISGVPILSVLNCFCCAGILFGGVMSVFFYKKEIKPDMSPLTSGDAVQLGAIAGVFGAILGTILSTLFFRILGNISGEMIMRMMESYRDQLPPGTFEQMEKSISEGGFSIVRLIISLIIDPLFGLLGGLIGFAMFKPKPAAANTQPPVRS
jgi:hypothetical protein